jgi:hypothetical protein
MPNWAARQRAILKLMEEQWERERRTRPALGAATAKAPPEQRPVPLQFGSAYGIVFPVSTPNFRLVTRDDTRGLAISAADLSEASQLARAILKIAGYRISPTQRPEQPEHIYVDGQVRPFVLEAAG